MIYIKNIILMQLTIVQILKMAIKIEEFMVIAELKILLSGKIKKKWVGYGS